MGSSDYGHRGSTEFWPPVALGYVGLNWAVWLVIWPERGTMYVRRHTLILSQIIPTSSLGLQNGDIVSPYYGHRGSIEFWPPLALGQSELVDIFLQVCGCVGIMQLCEDPSAC